MKSKMPVRFNELCKCGQTWTREQGTDERCPNCKGTGKGKLPREEIATNTCQPDLRGGQIWHQLEFPHRTHFLAYLSDDLWCLLTSPERGGCMAQHTENGHWLWNGRCLQKWLIENGYVCSETFQDQYKRTCEHLYATVPEAEGE